MQRVLDASKARSPELDAFKRRWAELLVRSKLNIRDDLRVLNVLWDKFHIEKAAAAEELAPLWRETFGSPKASRLRHVLYLNVPFCAQKCSFCKFQVRIGASRADVARYVDDTILEMKFFSKFLSGVRFNMFQVGGGTPSLLSPEEMERLFGAAVRLYDIDADVFRSIEFHPASTTKEKLLAAKKMGFNRVSFGVQSLSPRILARVNRGDQTEAHVRSAVRAAHAAGFAQVAVELITGLCGDSPSIFIDSVRRLIQEKPTSLSINQLNLTEDYMRAEGIRPTNYQRYRGMIAHICDRLRREAPRLGYFLKDASPVCGIWNLVREDQPRPDASRQEQQPLYCTLGLGQPSWSRITGKAWYQRTKSDFSPQGRIYMMRRLAPAMEIAEYLHNRLINGSRIQFQPFTVAFGTDFRERYELEIALLKRFGKIRADTEGISFLPTDFTERFFYGSMFFIQQWMKTTAGGELLTPEVIDGLRRDILGPRRSGWN